MSSISSTIDNMCEQLATESKRISAKKSSTNKAWEGSAQDAFESSHDEMENQMQRAIRKIKNMDNAARSLENAMQAADRDRAAKRAALKYQTRG